MTAKTLAMTAVTCAAAIFGTSMTPAFAEPMTYDLQATEIQSGVETQELSQAVRNRNTIIGVVAGAAAIAAIVNHNKKKKQQQERYNDDDYYGGGDYHDRNNNRSNRRNAPPPPPMPNSHSR